MVNRADDVGELSAQIAKESLKPEKQDQLANLYAAYFEKKELISADQVRSYTYVDNKLYFRSFCSLLSKAYPNKPDIIQGLLGIKSHGIGFRLDKRLREEGLRQFPPGYLDLGPMPSHVDADFKVIVHPNRFPIETFPTVTFSAIADYLMTKGAKICFPEQIPDTRLIELIKKVHTTVDLPSLLLNRSKQDKTTQQIDDYEYPLDSDIFEYIKKALSVLLEAACLKDRLVIAIPGVVSNHSTSSRGYFNPEAILSTHLANQGKNITLLDLDASFADGTTQICLEKKNITLIGIQTDPFVDPTINYRDYCKTQDNNFQFNIEPGLNGKAYVKVLTQAVQKIPKDTDLLLISFGTNLYVFDSVGLQCVEERYFRRMGEIVGQASKEIPKIIITPAGGYEEYAPQLFTEFCLGVRGAL